MAEAYNDIMNRIELTAEARARILGNLRNMDLSETQGTVVRFPQRKRYAALAACLAGALLAAVALPRLRNTTEPPDDGPDNVEIANGIVDLDSAETLSGALGFDMPEPRDLPFEVLETSYASYWGELGQITYTGAEQSATFRAARGNEDISGDYNIYADIREMTTDVLSATLKGNNGRYSLAVWQDGGCSFALSFEQSVTEQEMTDTIRSVG